MGIEIDRKMYTSSQQLANDYKNNKSGLKARMICYADDYSKTGFHDIGERMDLCLAAIRINNRQVEKKQQREINTDTQNEPASGYESDDSGIGSDDSGIGSDDGGIDSDDGGIDSDDRAV